MTTLSKDQIDQIVANHAQVINTKYEAIPYTVLVCLKGGFAYGSSLLLKLRGPLFVEFCQPSSYQNNESGELQLGTLPNVPTKSLLIVDDVWGTGKTLTAIEKHYASLGHDVAMSCLLSQSRTTKLLTSPHETSDSVFGFGLDNNQLWRNLPHIQSI